MAEGVETEGRERFKCCGVECRVEMGRDLVWSGGSEGLVGRRCRRHWPQYRTGEVCLVEVGGACRRGVGRGWSLVERIVEEYRDGLVDWSWGRAHYMQWRVGVT